MIHQGLLSISNLMLFAELGGREVILLGLAAFLVLIGILFLVFFAKYFTLWLQAYMSNARVGPLNLVWMGLRQVNPGVIVEGKIMAMQAGVGTDPDTGISTERLEAHYLAGGDVPRVINAIIAAPAGRHRSRLRSCRRNRPGGPRRVGRGPHERSSQSDRLPRSAEVAQEHAQRRGQKRG